MLAKIAFSALIVLLCLVSQGMGQCTVKNLTVATSATGKLAKGKPVQQVTVKNDCYCGQSNVQVDCSGLQSSVPLVNLTRVDDSKCLVNNGDIIYPHESVTFSYAWDTVFSFTVVDSQVSCS